MSVEIWKGVCNGTVNTYNTCVDYFPVPKLIHISQTGDSPDGDVIVMDEAQAIDIALCILAELAPGMFYNLKRDD